LSLRSLGTEAMLMDGQECVLYDAAESSSESERNRNPQAATQRRGGKFLSVPLRLCVRMPLFQAATARASKIAALRRPDGFTAST